MTGRILSFLFLALNTLSAQDPYAPLELEALAKREGQRYAEQGALERGSVASGFDIVYHRAFWEVDPAVIHIRGSVTTHFRAVDPMLDHLYFDLAENLEVLSVKRLGSEIPWAQEPGDRLRIDLPLPLSTGEVDSVTVQYEGVPVKTGFGSFAQAFHNGVPVLWTLSEPYGAKTWWPCKQDLADKIDSIDILVRTPAAYRAASNGLLRNTQSDGTSTVYHWQHRYPMAAYLVAFAVTDYAVYSDHVPMPDGDSLEVLNYVYPEQLAEAQERTKDIVGIMGLFQELFTPYPFAQEKYGHAQCGFGGGMEHQTMSFMGNFGFELQAHELAHQWFGDQVTCGSWEDIWLHEGFATYLSGLCYQYIQPQWWYTFRKGRIDHVTSQPGGSVWVNDTTSVGRIFNGRLSYAKGAMVLHMLRWVMGDEAFFQGIRDYLQDTTLVYGFARTHDLKAHLQAQGNWGLDSFFADWIYGEGYPSYQVAWKSVPGGIRVRLDQTTSHPSVAFFALPVPLVVHGAGQSETLRLEHAFSGQEFEVPLPFIPDSVTFDPDLWLISAKNTVSLLTATDEPELERTLRVQPNPAHAAMRLDLPYATGWTIRILDALGRTVANLEVNGTSLTWDCSGLPEGHYRIVASDGTSWLQTALVRK